jgi:hypothetical protein
MRGVSCIACSRPPATRACCLSLAARSLFWGFHLVARVSVRLHPGQAVAFSPCGAVSFPHFAPAWSAVSVNLFARKVGALAGLGQTELSRASVF